MTTKLTDLIQVYDDVINEENCKQLIEIYKKNRKHQQIHKTDGYRFRQLSLNQVPETVEIAKRFAKHLIPFYENYFTVVGFKDYVNINAFEEVRIKHYVRNSDDEFKTHVDVVDNASASRFLVTILYLNDNDGITEFPQLGMSVKPKTGRVIMFPPLWMYPHRGATPTDNDKYIMMTSLRYT